MRQQEQFLDVVDRDEAERRFHAALKLEPLGEEWVALDDCLGRVLARDVIAPIDVPSFDRSNYDGFAVRAADTNLAQEERPQILTLLTESVATGQATQIEVADGQAVGIATGGMLPRGADAIVMVEHAEIVAADSDQLHVRRAVSAGHGITYTGTDIAAGEMVLSAGSELTSRETGVLAALGLREVALWRQPRVAIISTGDEIIPPGAPPRPGAVYDSNARILADAVRELGGRPQMLGIVADDEDALRERIDRALSEADVVLLSGGTSKGQGDLCYRIVEQVPDLRVVAHGVALKPGKPICLGAHGGKPVVILPGFPTSAIFTFHEFVAPVIRRLAGRRTSTKTQVTARLATKINSEIGRTEYTLVGLVHAQPDGIAANESQPLESLVAYPMGKGSGSVTAFSRADGFITIGRHQEIVEAGSTVTIQLVGRDLRIADLVVIGSHCPGLDFLVSRLRAAGWQTKSLNVGSGAGLDAARRGECDIAGIHLRDRTTGQYNLPFLSERLQLVPGYGRRQGLVYRQGDSRFEHLDPREAIARAVDEPNCVMVNRNLGSGTRNLIDHLLNVDSVETRPRGYAAQVRNHNAVATAIAQGRADWGIAIESAVDSTNRSAIAAGSDTTLGFAPLEDEQFDFVVPKSRIMRPPVQEFVRLLDDPDVRARLRDHGYADS